MLHLLYHDLETGQQRLSWLHEIEPRLLAELRDWLARTLVVGHGRIPYCKPIADLVIRDHGVDWFYGRLCNEEEMPVATVALASDAATGERLWQALHTPARKAGLDPVPTPRAYPWMACRCEPDIRYVPDTRVWLGDFARCLAWAMLTLRRE